MSKIERSVVVDRPIGEVFEFVHDPTKDALWQATIVESQLLTEGPMRAGSQIREVRRFLGVPARNVHGPLAHPSTQQKGGCEL